MGTPRKVSIIVPCFDEEPTVPLLREVLGEMVARSGPADELDILFVDDGSGDGTLAALQPLARALNGQVLVHGENRGIAEAFRTGFRAATGEFVCTIDADCTFDPRELFSMLADLESSGADIIVASPYHPGGGVEGVPAWRVALSRIASWAYGRILPVKLHSYTACFRLFRREVVERIQFEDPGFLGVTQMLASAIGQGFKVVERPVVLRARKTGVSKMRTLHVVRGHLRFMFGLLLARS